MATLGDFINNGQQRRSWLDENVADFVEYITPPNLRPAAEFAAQVNPIQGMSDSMAQFGVATDPTRSMEDRRNAAINAVTEGAIALAPAALGAAGYMKPAQAAMEGLLGWSPATKQIGDDMGRFLVDEAGALYSPLGRNVDDAVELARSGDAIFHSSDPSQFDEINQWGVEPSYGPWTREIAAGAVDDVDEFLSNAPEAAWWSDKPDWVLAKTSRAAGKPVSELTIDDVRKYGHLSIAKADEYEDLAFRILDEGLDNGGYSVVEDLAGNRMRLYETPLYEHNNYGGSSYPFGIERNEIVTREAIEPYVSLTGDELVDFMRKYDPTSLSRHPVTQRGDEILDLLKRDPMRVTDEMLDMGADTPRLNEYLFRNYDLPMDQASRMARAEEMGFGGDLYHGTDKDFVTPNDNFYTTPDTDYANIYAGSPYDEGGQVIPLMQREGAVLDTRTDEGRRVFEDEFFMKYGNASPLTGKGVPDWVEGPDFGEMFSDTGLPHSGVFLDEGKVPLGDGSLLDRGISTLHFDPANIRSRFARFDPRLSHLANLSAGLGGVGLLGVMNRDDLDRETAAYLGGI